MAAPGGYSFPEPPNDLVQDICDMVKLNVQETVNKKYALFTPVQFREQKVNPGINFLIKVHVGGTDYIHIRVNQTNGVNNVAKVQEGKAVGDPLNPF